MMHHRINHTAVSLIGIYVDDEVMMAIEPEGVGGDPTQISRPAKPPKSSIKLGNFGPHPKTPPGGEPSLAAHPNQATTPKYGKSV